MYLKHQTVGLLALFSSSGLADLMCRPEGPVVPKPKNLEDSPIFQKAVAKLSKNLESALKGDIAAGWDVKNSSFSLAVTTADQREPGIPIWEYHHLSSANSKGTKKLDRDSQYLIGSVTKVLSAYLLLQADVNLDDPVTKFLPTLKDPKSLIEWNSVTLRMLASELSGTPANYGFSEYYYLKDVFEAIGFPPLKDSDFAPCGIIGLNGNCDKKQYLKGLVSSYPITAPMERPAYSNLAFTVFAFALEEATGKNYTELIKDIIAEPLEMHDTAPSPGNTKKAVVPPGDSSWGGDYGFNAPGGGLVSTISDLSKFNHAILSRTLNITEAKTREWLKPEAFAGGPNSMVGMPWEIFRPVNITPNHPHPVTIYSKGGGAQMYRSQISIVDEYGIAVTMLTAGPMTALTYISGTTLSTIISAVDEVSRNQAKSTYAYTFKSPCNAKKDVPYSAKFELDGDSLVLKSLKGANGTDLRSNLRELWQQTIGTYVATLGDTIRLFPTDLDEEVQLNGKAVTKEVWRLWPELEIGEKSDLPGVNLAKDDCVTYTIGDWVWYGGEPTDRLVFYKNKAGDVIGVEFPFLRTGVLEPQ